MNQPTYQSLMENPANTIALLGKGPHYLSDDDRKPWLLVTSCEPGGTHRLELVTSVWFYAKDPSNDLEFHWSFDIEPYSANGTGSYVIDATACRSVLARLPEPAYTQFRTYLSDCANKVQKKGLEWQEIANKRLRDAAELHDLACSPSTKETA